MPIEQLISFYGAIGILVGTFFEGEAIVILAAFAAHDILEWEKKGKREFHRERALALLP